MQREGLLLAFPDLVVLHDPHQVGHGDIQPGGHLLHDVRQGRTGTLGSPAGPSRWDSREPGTGSVRQRFLLRARIPSVSRAFENFI